MLCGYAIFKSLKHDTNYVLNVLGNFKGELVYSGLKESRDLETLNLWPEFLNFCEEQQTAYHLNRDVYEDLNSIDYSTLSVTTEKMECHPALLVEVYQLLLAEGTVPREYIGNNPLDNKLGQLQPAMPLTTRITRSDPNKTDYTYTRKWIEVVLIVNFFTAFKTCVQAKHVPNRNTDTDRFLPIELGLVKAQDKKLLLEDFV